MYEKNSKNDTAKNGSILKIIELSPHVQIANLRIHFRDLNFEIQNIGRFWLFEGAKADL